MASIPKNPVKTMTFGSISQDDIPHGRKGKHHAIVLQLLHEIEELEAGKALKIPISELPDSMVNVRAALNRASKQRSLEIETSSDDDHFYVWKTNVNGSGA